MSNYDANDKLIIEEQKILDNVVDGMEKILNELDHRAKRYVEEGIAARDAGIHDNYYAFLLALRGLRDTKENRSKLEQARDELYDTRVELFIDNDKTKTTLQIGDHSFNHHNQVFVTAWNRPICRALWGGQMPEEYEFDNYNDKGEFVAHVKCKLQLRRNIELRFTKVKSVTHVFPLTKEEQDEIIIDILTQELAERRTDNEWRSIIKSIQQKQKEIVLSPLNQNLIVQGCAGSGKTMIMLHRLPIVLMDNPMVLQKNNLYIITPSKTYIQLALDMTRKLEIADIQMGILNDYYDYCISKYQLNTKGYGKINPSVRLTSEQEQYVYSKRILSDIVASLQSVRDRNNVDLKIGQDIFGITRQIPLKTSLADYINADIVDQQRVLNANEKVLNEYFVQIRELFRQCKRLSAAITQTRLTIEQEIKKAITAEKEKIKKAEKELEELTEEDDSIKWKNRTIIIQNANYRIVELTNTFVEVRKDDQYFNLYKPAVNQIREIERNFEGMNELYEKNNTKTIYAWIERKNDFAYQVDIITEYVSSIEIKYFEFSKSYSGIIDQMNNSLMILLNNDTRLLDSNEYHFLKEVSKRYRTESDNAVFRTYAMILQKLGILPNKDGELEAISYSPYIYLQVLYNYYGAHNGTKESLITIDEAQGIAAEEIRLIRNINGEKLIFNLFGDVKQHIEGTKGIDSWEEINPIFAYKEYSMQDNYRNASQITNFCNSSFADMNMRAMNTAGKGVTVLNDEAGFISAMQKQFLDVNRTGLAAIIVKNELEVDYIKDVFANFTGKMSDMTGTEYDVHRTRWNILTVAMSKGLEFKTVVVISGNMTENEKYIAYTRALDELLVYGEHINTSKYSAIRRQAEDKKREEVNKTENDKTGKPARAKQAVYAESKVKEYFESCKLEVIDNRSSSGQLWVIGEKDRIEQYVNHAVKEFGISGMYSSGKGSKFRNGWCTKTKK